MISTKNNIIILMRRYIYDLATCSTTVDGRVYIDTINGKDVYSNRIDSHIYIKQIELKNYTGILGIKQGNDLIVTHKNLKMDDYIFNKNNRIFLYKDIKMIKTFSEFDVYEYTIDTSDNLAGLDILKVTFNGEQILNYTFNSTLRKITLLDTDKMFFRPINSIEVIFGNRGINIADLTVVLNYIDHFNKEDVGYYMDTYVDYTNSIQDWSMSRGLYDNISNSRNMFGVTPHSKVTNIRTEIVLKALMDFEENYVAYGEGHYGEGHYGGSMTSVSDLILADKFRIVLLNSITQMALIYNNCRVKLDYQMSFNKPDSNTLDLTVEANKELKINYLVEEKEVECT